MVLLRPELEGMIGMWARNTVEVHGLTWAQVVGLSESTIRQPPRGVVAAINSSV